MPDNAALSMPSPGTDPSGKPRPALSATRDLPPVIDPAASPPEQSSTPPAPDTPQAGAEPAPPAASSEPKRDETPPWLKAELTKLRNRARQAERERDDERNQRMTAVDALKNIQTPKVEPKPEPTAPRPVRPRRDAFESPQAYESALDQYDVHLATWAHQEASKETAVQTRREMEEKQRKDKEEADKKQQNQVAQAIQERWEQNIEKATEKYPDWEEVARADDVLISEPMAATLMLIENGAEVAYWLGKHKQEVNRIRQLAPAVQAFELGRLSAGMGEKPQVSKAPPPIKPVRSAAAAVPREIDELSMDEYAAQALPRINPARARQLGLVK